METKYASVHFAVGGARCVLVAALAAAFAAGCATTDGLFGGTQSTHQAASGAAIGAVAGNVLGYMTDSDRTTTTVLGALIGGGIGYWRGLDADRRLQQAQATSQDIAQVQQSQTRYQYDQPKLYARETVRDGRKVATFDKLETPIPYDAVRYRSEDAVAVLRKLGALAARNEADISVFAPSGEARDFMIAQLRRGADPTRLAITSSYSKETKVVLEQIP